jgi:hypothetical protein
LTKDKNSLPYKPMKHLIWSNNDANDSFEIEGDSFQEVLLNTLSELGWSVSEKPIEEEPTEDEFPEGVCFIEATSKIQPLLMYLVKGRYSENNYILGDYKVLVYGSGEVNTSSKYHSSGAFPKNEYTFKLSNKTF